MPSPDFVDVAREHLDAWDLRPDGTAHHGSRAYVVPVRTRDNTAAILKVTTLDPATEHEHLVLRRWGGVGAVRLLRANPRRRALLLERADGPDLETVTDTAACEIVAGLYGRLHTPAMPQLRSLTAHVQTWSDELARLPRGAPIPHRLVEQSAALGRDLTAEPVGADVVLHGDLTYRNVLAAHRENWLTISPRPLNGDPHYEVAPMLWDRWDELAGNIRDGVRHRFYTLVDAAGLDEDRARAWTLVRVVAAAVRELHQGTDNGAALTRCVAIAKAVQD